MTVHDYKLISPNYNLYLRGKIYDKICGEKYSQCFWNRCVNNSFVQSLICALEMWLHHKVLKVYEKNIDLFITPSNFVKDKLITAGYDRNKIKVVSHFCNPSGPMPHRITSPSKGEDNVGNYLLYFGRISEEKGIGVLIEAMKQLPDLKLKIVGEGPQFRNYGLQVTSYGLQNIKFLGYKNLDELQSLIKAAYLVIVPSLSPETFGLSALEAIALGKCVVGSDIGALPELIDNNFLFSPGNVFELVELIKKLTNDPNSVIINGQENKEKTMQLYGKERHYTQLHGLYLSLG
jgi:glycosyltransferase involved in cell wall biosynthesis